MFHRKQAIERWYNFPHHLISASALPCKSGKTKISSFHLNMSCFANKVYKHSKHVLLKDKMSFATCFVAVSICRDPVVKYLIDSVHWLSMLAEKDWTSTSRVIGRSVLPRGYSLQCRRSRTAACCIRKVTQNISQFFYLAVQSLTYTSSGWSGLAL